jgi:cytochrome c
MQDPLFSNKIAAAVLTALLLIFGLPQLTAALFGGGHHGGEGELHLAYGGDLELDTGGGAAAEEAPKADLGTLLAGASAAGGERRAALCKSCHTFDQGGANGTGPNLWGVVGRAVASHAGFNYTNALKGAGGDWTYERLDQYLKNSQEYVPGTAMVQRFPKDEQRADILAYLATLSDSPVPFPAPTAAPETEANAGDAAPVVESAEEILEDEAAAGAAAAAADEPDEDAQ